MRPHPTMAALRSGHGKLVKMPAAADVAIQSGYCSAIFCAQRIGQAPTRCFSVARSLWPSSRSQHRSAGRPRNPTHAMTMTLSELKKLHQKKYRASTGFYLVEGEHLILELQKAARRNPALNASQLYVTAKHEQWRTPFTKHVISERQMQQLADTRTPQGLIAVVPILPPAPPTAGERAVYFHEIQDPGNLGTVLRTLAWFGGFRCLLSPGSVDPYNAKAVRASM